jgi:hypothetical protein
MIRLRNDMVSVPCSSFANVCVGGPPLMRPFRLVHFFVAASDATALVWVGPNFSRLAVGYGSGDVELHLLAHGSECIATGTGFACHR